MQVWTSQFFLEVTQCWVKVSCGMQAQNLDAIHECHQLSAWTARRIFTRAIGCVLITLVQGGGEAGVPCHAWLNGVAMQQLGALRLHGASKVHQQRITGCPEVYATSEISTNNTPEIDDQLGSSRALTI